MTAWRVIGGSLVSSCVFSLAVFSSAVSQSYAHGFGNGNDGSQSGLTLVKVQMGPDRAEVFRLQQAGYDIAGVNLQNGTVDVISHDSDRDSTIRSMGLQVLSTKAIDPTLAPESSYQTPAKVEAALKQFERDYPGLVRVESIGKSNDNRDIWAIKITDNPDQRERDEPAILFNSMHHAREVMTPEVTLDTVDYLLTRYGTDADVTKWVDHNEIWVVPMVNPDGNNKVWNGSSMWRKNNRGGYGVDINRNYPFAWNSCGGSSGNSGADDYRGPSAGSEPETQALMGLVTRIQPVFSISYHSYSELVIYPYGCNGRYAETKSVVQPIAEALAAAIPSDSGRGHYEAGTPWELLYDVDGGDIDWMYNVQHVIPFVIELNSDGLGFQPPFRYRQPTVEKLRNAWTLLLEKLEGSGVRGVVADGAGRSLPTSTVTVEDLSSFAAPATTWQVKSDGTYHVVLNPGSYRLTFTDQSGRRTVSEQVMISDSRVNLDVNL